MWDLRNSGHLMFTLKMKMGIMGWMSEDPRSSGEDHKNHSGMGKLGPSRNGRGASPRNQSSDFTRTLASEPLHSSRQPRGALGLSMYHRGTDSYTVFNFNLRTHTLFSYWKTLGRIEITWICKSTFSTIHSMKSKCRLSISDKNLESRLRCARRVKCTRHLEDLVPNCESYYNFYLVTCWSIKVLIYWAKSSILLKLTSFVSFYIYLLLKYTLVSDVQHSHCTSRYLMLFSPPV